MTPVTRFAPPPEHFVLNTHDVHLWRARLKSAAEDAIEILSPDECSRASRFHFDRDRLAFIASRSMRRQILSRYLGVHPSLLEFAENDFGKPHLTLPVTPLRFNVSHAGDLLLIGISHNREIGVDIELVRENVAFDDLAKRHFPPLEATGLKLLPPTKKAEAFFESWTRLEAELKAIGVGLHDSSARSTADSWSTQSFIPEAGYRAALTVEATSCNLSFWSFEQA